MTRGRPSGRLTPWTTVGTFTDFVGAERITYDAPAKVFDINPRARRTYEKCGFRYEGTQRDAHYDADGWHDVIGMALLATDPRTDTGADPL